MVKIRFVLDEVQHTAGGNFLSWMYYLGGSSLLDLLDDNTGYGHEGAKHLLRPKMSKQDILAWLEIAKEVVPRRHQEGLMSVEASVLEQLQERL